METCTDTVPSSVGSAWAEALRSERCFPCGCGFAAMGRYADGMVSCTPVSVSSACGSKAAACVNASFTSSRVEKYQNVAEANPNTSNTEAAAANRGSQLRTGSRRGTSAVARSCSNACQKPSRTSMPASDKRLRNMSVRSFSLFMLCVFFNSLYQHVFCPVQLGCGRVLFDVEQICNLFVAISFKDKEVEYGPASYG